MKKLSLPHIIMLNIAMVVTIQSLPTNAIFGTTLISYFTFAVLFFLLPCAIATSFLATAFPTTGGSYIWVSQAFGSKLGFFSVCIQWLCNLIWYPTILSLIAAIIAYIFQPELVNNKFYMIASSVSYFWLITILNFFGIRVSSTLSGVFAAFGVIIPIVLIIGLSIYNVSTSPTTLSFSYTDLIPTFDYEHIGFLIQVFTSLVGLEMAAVHAGDVKKPQKNFPNAIVISSIMIVLLLLSSSLAISSVVPTAEINIVTGMIDAFSLFFSNLGLSKYMPLLLILIFIGTLGNLVAWMISSTRAMHVGTSDCHFPGLLHRTNKWDAPVSILVLEAIIITFITMLYFFMPTVHQGFWILIDMASQISFLYYILIFASVIKLVTNHKHQPGEYKIPGGKYGAYGFMLTGIISATIAITTGFFPPGIFEEFSVIKYHGILLTALAITMAMPFLLIKINKLYRHEA